MDRTSKPRRVTVILTLLTAVALSIWAKPAAAQGADGRYRILVPIFLNTVENKDGWGKDVAEEVRKVLDRMPKHRSVSKDELKDPLKQYGLKEQDLMDCSKARQLAGRTGFELVMCGEYAQHQQGKGASVSVQILSPDGANTFEVEQFDAASPEDAATRIAAEFSQFTQQLELATYCNEEMQSENWQRAIELCDRSLEINPGHFGSVYNKASAQWKLGQTQAAFEGFKRALEIKPTDDNSLKSLALIATELGNAEEAERYFKEYLILNPGDMQVRLTLAVDAANAGNPVLGLRMIEEGMTADSVDPVALEYAGQMAMNAASSLMREGPANGANTEARAMFEKAIGYLEQLFDIQGAEMNPQVLPNLLIAYTQIDRLSDALAFGERAIATAPDNAGLLSAYANALQKAGRIDDAIAMLRRAGQADPSVKVHGPIAQWELQRGNIQAGIEELKAAMSSNELTPEQVDLLTQQLAASTYGTIAKAGEYDRALEIYAQARTLTQNERTQGMIDFLEAMAYFEPADAAMRQASTAAHARAQLPKLEKAKQLMTSAGRWATEPRDAQNRANVLKTLNDWIELANALIKRGGG